MGLEEYVRVSGKVDRIRSCRKVKKPCNRSLGLHDIAYDIAGAQSGKLLRSLS